MLFTTSSQNPSSNVCNVPLRTCLVASTHAQERVWKERVCVLLFGWSSGDIWFVLLVKNKSLLCTRAEFLLLHWAFHEHTGGNRTWSVFTSKNPDTSAVIHPPVGLVQLIVGGYESVSRGTPQRGRPTSLRRMFLGGERRVCGVSVQSFVL